MIFAHARWILLVTLAVIAAVSALVLLQTPRYVSVADVLVQAGPSATLQPDMGTEAGVAASGAVLAAASRSLHVPRAELASGLSVHEPGTTFLLQISHSDPGPRVAQQRAQAVAAAYVAYRSAQSARARHDAVTASPAAQASPPVATLITPASLPAAPSSPDKAVDIGAALIVGLALALGSAWLRDHLDDRVRGAADLEDQSGAPVLAQVPAFRSSSRHPAARLAMTSSPDSPVAQSYRELRARLVHGAHRNAMTLLVTSPAGEDRAEVAANLATAFAQSGHSTVLVCGDLRSGRADEMFGLAGEDGFAAVLEGRSATAAALRSSRVPGLRVLPRGAAPLDPAALLQGPGCLDVFSDLGRQAGVIIIEAPPLLAAADAVLLADHADRILLVADARRSTRTQVRTGMQDIGPVRGQIAGWVLSNVGQVHRLREPEPVAAGHGHGGLSDVLDAWPADTVAGSNGQKPVSGRHDGQGRTEVAGRPARR